VPYEIGKDKEGRVTFNGWTKADITHPKFQGLNFFQIVCKPRLLQLHNKSKNLDRKQFEEFSEVLKCAICLEIMNDPTNVKHCNHKFCASCIEKYIRAEKKCPSCRVGVGSRRHL
jgi:hypothetical protein